MEPTEFSFTERLRRGEDPGGLARDALGSWPYIGGVVIFMTIVASLADRHDHHAGTALLDLVVSGFTLLTVSLVLMATRRIERTASERRLYALASAGRVEAVIEEVLRELDQVNSGLAGLTARIETLNIRCRGPGGEDL